jgi:hypothetical protein
MRRAIFAAALAVVCATPLFAQEKAAPSAALPAGWQMRLDKETADAAKLSFAAMGGGFHATTGPAAIFWKPENNMKGDFKITATFTQTKAPTHPEAYGLFVGGKDLDSEKQEYGYIVIRGDGKYAIKHRAGAEVHTIQDWTDLPGMNKQDAAGKATNTVAFVVSGDAVKALINGTEVKSWDKGYWGAQGFAGLRINHNLDVHVSDFAITAK